MARRAAKVDGNHAAIVSALRSAGYSVQSLAEVGDGCPDILVGVERTNVLMEIKDPSQSATDRRLNGRQKRWHAEWQGTAHLVETVDQALAVVDFYRSGRKSA